MSIDWSLLKADTELRRLLKGDQFEAVLRNLGIDSASVKTVTIFTGLNSRANSGLLLRGSFDGKEIAAGLKAKGWNQESLDGHKVYVNAADYIAMPANNTVFAGTRAGAEGMFRAANNAKESVVASDAYKKINAALSAKGQPVRAYLLIQQGTLEMADAALAATSFALSLCNLGGVGRLLQAANVARGFAVSVDHGTLQKYPVELCVLLRDEDSATFVNGSLNALKTISAFASPGNHDGESLRALREMSIVRKQEVLAVKMEIPGSALFGPSSR